MIPHTISDDISSKSRSSHDNVNNSKKKTASYIWNSDKGHSYEEILKLNLYLAFVT